MTRIACFLMEYTGVTRFTLRRYVCSRADKCPGKQGYHNAHAPFQDSTEETLPEPEASDPRWPTKCEGCDYQFKPGDEWQVFPESLVKRLDTGEITTTDDAPVGAMWFMKREFGSWIGPDGKTLVVKTPGGTWYVDSEASNCTKKNDYVHKCWCRHGIAPKITVNKIGNTCQAGAGSILIGNYHGFLRNGFLESC
jgi:hypothetical protein